MSRRNVPDWPGLEPEVESLDPLVARLAELDGPADESGEWPQSLWEALVEAGANRWATANFDRAGLIRRYARVAEGSLTAAFLLTQHDAAVRRLAASENSKGTADDWLARIAEGRAFATVGISQLTTSRRRGPEAMLATAEGDGFRLNGAMPWVTAAEKADVIVTGAVTADARQLLIALPTDRPGVAVHPAFSLAALQASRTTEVACENVRVDPEDVLIGPSADVMASPGLAGTGGLETSALALGQARIALLSLDRLAEESTRDDLAEPIDALGAEWLEIASSLIAAAESRPDAPAPSSIRLRANAFALRATQAYLTARKGTGFLRSEPAQRYARQALFFLVWSCPAPVAQAALRDLAGLCEA